MNRHTPLHQSWGAIFPQRASLASEIDCVNIIGLSSLCNRGTMTHCTVLPPSYNSLHSYKQMRRTSIHGYPVLEGVLGPDMQDQAQEETGGLRCNCSPSQLFPIIKKGALLYNSISSIILALIAASRLLPNRRSHMISEVHLPQPWNKN